MRTICLVKRMQVQVANDSIRITLKPRQDGRSKSIGKIRLKFIIECISLGCFIRIGSCHCVPCPLQKNITLSFKLLPNVTG